MLTSGASIDEKRKYNIQIMALYERAAKSEDEHIRNNAVFMLATKYMGNGENDKAQEILDLLPEGNAMDKRQLQANLWVKQGKLSEAAILLEGKLLLMGITEVQIILISLADIAVKEGKDQDAIHIAEVACEKVKLFNLWKYYSFVAPLQVALGKENVNESISLIKSMLEAMLKPCEMKGSPLYRHIAFKGNQENAGKLMLPGLLSEFENAPKYAFLNFNEEYQQLIKQYRAKC